MIYIKIQRICNRQLSLLLLLAFLPLKNVYSQEDVQLINEFDERIGKENLPLNNGTVHINTFRVINEKNRYYSNDFLKGDVSYNGQIYYGIDLKYDLFEDVVVVNSSGTGINLIKAKLDSFSLDNKKFVNLDNIIPSSQKRNISGNYEKVAHGSNLILYVKYYKNSRRKKGRNSIYYEFEPGHEFLLFHNNVYHPISSRRDLGKIFPEMKNKINEFYQMNKEMANTNEVLFYKNMISTISNTLDSTTR